MSRENLEIVSKGFAALNAGGAEALAPFLSPDVVMHSIAEWPEDPVYRGHDGLRKLVDSWNENFDEWAFEVQHIRDAGPSVVALAELTGHIKGSQVPVRLPIGAVFSDFRDGAAGEVRFFIAWEQALEAAGLSE